MGRMPNRSDATRGRLTGVFAMTALLVVACGAPPDQTSDTKIVGGTAVATSDPIIASTAALVSPDGNAFCTGTLISSSHLLTAAHCLIEYSERSLYVAFGQKAMRGYFATERLRAASSFIVHPDFSFDKISDLNPSRPVGDIALVKLAEPMAAPYKAIAPMTLSDEVKVGEPLVLAGYGRTSMWWWARSGELRKVTTKVASLSPAAKELDFGPTVGKTSCNGDSGGPAFVMRNGALALVGVTSRGDYCYSEGTYTDVRHYEDWLETSMASLP